MALTSMLSAVARGLRPSSEAIGRSYSQILLSRSVLVGLLLVAATTTQSRALLYGLGAVMFALCAAHALQFAPENIRSGLLSYNALLVGIGGAAMFGPGPETLLLVAAGVLAVVVSSAALHAALGLVFGLPALTLPFLFVFWLMIGAAPLLGIPVQPQFEWAAGWLVWLPGPLTTYLESLGALFFLPHPVAGLLVFLALLVFSRIAVLLSALGFGLALAMGIHLVAIPDGFMPLVLGYNFMLVAIALGGVWFVPSWSSFVLAMAGVLVTGVITLGALPLLARGGIPLFILPFNLSVLLFLYALRYRVRDSRPKAVDFLLGTPEENLNYFRTRLARFGARYFVRFRFPFLGRWTVTQGSDGPISHRGPWRHAFDFEVVGPDDRFHKGRGVDPGEFHCYRLPVVAPADGTVVTVVDRVPDNKIGDVNLDENWGNLVIIQHAPWLYSMVCHLAPGSIKVQEGQLVREGNTLGLCGNSGRSPKPHLHFQLQASARVGSPTIAGEFHDVILHTEGQETLVNTVEPSEGASVRNISPQPDLDRLLRFPYGETLTFDMGDTRTGRKTREEIEPGIDLNGSMVLRSNLRGGILYYEHRSDRMFTVFDALAPRRSVLHLIRVALARVPFEDNASLVWKDHLLQRATQPIALRLLLDPVSPFLAGSGPEMRYHAERKLDSLAIIGRSTESERGSEPRIRTLAVFRACQGLTLLEVSVRGKTTRAERVLDGADAKRQPTTKGA